MNSPSEPPRSDPPSSEIDPAPEHPGLQSGDAPEFDPHSEPGDLGEESELAESELAELELAELEAELESSGKRKLSVVSLRCFHCNRPEKHFLAYRRRWYYSYLTGLTLGLITLIGPFKCRCCGANRLSRIEWLHPKIWLQPAPVNKK